MELNQSVNFISLDQSVKLPYNYRNSKQKIYKIKEAIRTANFIKSLHKCHSQPKFPRFASKMVMANIPSTLEKELLLRKNKQKPKDFKSIDQDISLLLQRNIKGDRYENNIKKRSKLYYPVIKSPYQLIEDLRGAVVNISQYKSNGPMIHEMRSEYLLDKISKEERLKKEKMIKSKQAIRPADEEEEMYDAFIIEDTVESELKRNIKNFLGLKDNKLNQIVMTKEPFFNLKENLVNFHSDVYLVPHLKNNLNSYPVTKDSQLEYFNNKNNINCEIQKYLYFRRLKLQKEKDKPESILKTTLNDQCVENENTLHMKKMMAMTTPIKGLSHLEIKQFEKDEIMLNKDLSIYELEDFFINKYVRYENTQIATEENKKFILNEFQYMSFQKYYRRHVPTIINKLI